LPIPFILIISTLVENQALAEIEAKIFAMHQLGQNAPTWAKNVLTWAKHIALLHFCARVSLHYWVGLHLCAIRTIGYLCANWGVTPTAAEQYFHFYEYISHQKYIHKKK
jgi:hypothetical protein